MINGVIFQKKDDKIYQGVDGDNWYLNDNFNEEWLDELDEKVEKAWYDDDWVDVCADNIFIKKYINYSEKEHIDYRVLLCETEKSEPCFDTSELKSMIPIGYDYAYAGGSYYSALYNELHFDRNKCFESIKLNKYGLIDDYEELKRFISLRNQLITSGGDLESGEFIIYKLYEVKF